MSLSLSPVLRRALALLLIAFVLCACRSKQERAEAFFQSGLRHVEAQQFDKARLEFLNAVQLAPTFADAYFQLALLAKREGDMPLVYENMSTAMILDRGNLAAKVQVAELLLFNQKFDEALDIANDALALAPDSYEALRIKAAARLGQKKFIEAEQLIAQAIAIRPDDDALHGLRAVIAKERGRDKEAIDYLNQAIALASDPSQYLVLRSGVHQSQQNSAALEADYRALMQHNPDKPQYLFALSKVLLDQQRYAEAETLLAAFVARNPKHMLARQFLVEAVQAQDAARAWQMLATMIADTQALPLVFFKARWLLAEERNNEAESLLQSVMNNARHEEKDRQKARAMLAELYIGEEKGERANALIAENLQRNPQHEHSLILKARQDLQKRDVISAIASLRTVLRYNPESVEGLVLLGHVYAASGSGLLADDSFRQALDLSPRNVDAAMPVVRNLLAAQDLERADKIIAQVLQAKPNDTELLLFHAQINLMKKDWSRVESIIAKLRRFPAVEAHTELVSARLLQARGRYAEAIEHFHRALMLRPDLLPGMQGLAASYIALQRERELLNFLHDFLQRHPELLYAHVVAAEVQQQLGQLPEAMAEMRKALAKQPDWARGYANLAAYQWQAGERDKVEATYREGMARNPGDHYLQMLLAEFFTKQNQFNEAIAVYEGVLNAEPNHLLAVNNLASLLLDRLGDPASQKRALLLANALREAEDAPLLDTYGWALASNGRWVEGEEVLRKALKLDNSLPEIKWHLGLTLERLERYEEARVMYRRALQQVNETAPLRAKLEAALQALSDKRSGAS